MARRVDVAALVAGVLIAAFGVILLLDAAGSVNLHLVALGPIAALIAGATLLTAGLTRRD